MRQAGELTNLLIVDLKPFPRNYRHHPPDQVARIAASLEQHGQYRNVVVQKNTGYILAGHGVIEAAKANGWESITAQVVDCGPEEAMQLLIDDNELSRHAEDDPEQLLEIIADLVNTERQPVAFNTEEIEDLLRSVTEPRFESVSQEEQPRLDEKKPVTCPNCGYEFTT